MTLGGKKRDLMIKRYGHMNTRKEIRPSIILVDDDADDQQLLSQAIQRITDKYHVDVVNSCRNLLELLAVTNDNRLPCLIILDYNMPGKNGKQALQILQNNKRYKSIPKVIYSTSGDTGDRLEFLSLGAKDYFVKPNSIREIVDTANKMLVHCHHQTEVMA
jgi:DNA-binding response OmpR family regulator